MPRADASRRRCAIYTRKSSEEGLEQEFNSLRGGNLERPAAQRLLTDIRAGRIDIAVVYRRQSRANPSLKPNSQFTGNFFESGLRGASTAAKMGVKPDPYGPIPYVSRTGLVGSRRSAPGGLVVA